jgi:hypothetical protein
MIMLIGIQGNKLTIETLNVVHTVKKKVAIFPSPAGMSLTKLSLAGIHPGWGGKIVILFFTVQVTL